MNNKKNKIVFLVHSSTPPNLVFDYISQLLPFNFPLEIVTTPTPSVQSNPFTPNPLNIPVKIAPHSHLKERLSRLPKQLLFMIHSQFRHWNFDEISPSHLPLFLEAQNIPATFYIAVGAPQISPAAIAAACHGAFLIYIPLPLNLEPNIKNQSILDFLIDAQVTPNNTLPQIIEQLKTTSTLPQQVQINYHSAIQHAQNRDYYSARLRQMFYNLQHPTPLQLQFEPPPNNQQNPLNVLIVVNTPIRYPIYKAAYGQHIYSLGKYSSHNIVYLNLFDIPFLPPEIKSTTFHIIIFHTVFLSYRWNIGPFTQLIRSSLLQPLKKSNAIKVAIPQDEYINTDILCEFINTFRIQYVFSVAPPSQWKKIYHSVDFNNVKFYRVLTGYLDEQVVSSIQSMNEGNQERPIHIGYRAHRTAYWLGEHGQLKWQIADFFLEKASKLNLKLDISTRPQDTIFGHDWYRFLKKCKYFIGVEGGASILSPDDILRHKTQNYLSRNPNATFQETRDACFPHKDGQFNLIALSPRHLEACASKTCQILVEGEYNHILKPWIHYIPLKKDFSNFQQVIQALSDDNLRETIVENAYRDIVQSHKYSYPRFADFIFQTIIQNQSLNPSPFSFKFNYSLFTKNKKFYQPIISHMYVNHLIQEGIRLFKQGKYPQSIPYFKSVLKEKTSHKSFISLAYFYLGEIAEKNSQKNSHSYFLKSIAALLSIKEKTDYHIYRLASLYKRINQFKQSRKWFNKMLKAPLQYAYAGGIYFHLAEMHFIKHNYKKAHHLFLKCLDIIPHHTRAQQLLQEIETHHYPLHHTKEKKS